MNTEILSSYSTRVYISSIMCTCWASSLPGGVSGVATTSVTTFLSITIGFRGIATGCRDEATAAGVQ